MKHKILVLISWLVQQHKFQVQSQHNNNNINNNNNKHRCTILCYHESAQNGNLTLRPVFLHSVR